MGWDWDGTFPCPLCRPREEDQPPADPSPVSAPDPFPGISCLSAGLGSCSVSPVPLPDPLPTLRNLGERNSTLSHSVSGGEFGLLPPPAILGRFGDLGHIPCGIWEGWTPPALSQKVGMHPRGAPDPLEMLELPDPIPASRFSLDSEIYAEILDESSRPRSGSRCFPWEFSIRGVPASFAHPKFQAHPQPTSQKILEELG